MKLLEICEILLEARAIRTCPMCDQEFRAQKNHMYNIKLSKQLGKSVYKCPSPATTFVASVGGQLQDIDSDEVPVSQPRSTTTPSPPPQQDKPVTRVEKIKQQIIAWLDEHNVHSQNVTFNSDLSVNIKQQSVVLSDIDRIPFKIRLVDGDFIITKAYGLKSLKNGPDEVTGGMVLRQCQDLTSLDGLPHSVKTLSIQHCPINNFNVTRPTVAEEVSLLTVNVNDFNGIDTCFETQILRIKQAFYGNILPLIEIPSIKEVHFEPGLGLYGLNQVAAIFNTLGKILNKAITDGGDIILLQDNLIEAGLTTFAGVEGDLGILQHDLVDSNRLSDGKYQTVFDAIKGAQKYAT